MGGRRIGEPGKTGHLEVSGGFLDTAAACRLQAVAGTPSLQSLGKAATRFLAYPVSGQPFEPFWEIGFPTKHEQVYKLPPLNHSVGSDATKWIWLER